MPVVTTSNYHFHFNRDSVAERELNEIIDWKERCFNEIATTLKVTTDFKIDYYLCESAQNLKKMAKIDRVCNRHLAAPYSAYVVHNDDVKCLGHREEALLISYEINRPNSNILREGLASWFDMKWRAKGNEERVDELLKNNEYVGIRELFNNYEFMKLDTSISFPIAGVFVGFLIEEYGLDRFLNIYIKQDFYIEEIEKEYGNSLEVIESNILGYFEQDIVI